MEINIQQSGNDLDVQVGCQRGTITRDTAEVLAQRLAEALASPPQPKYIWLYSEARDGAGWYGPYKSITLSKDPKRSVDTVFTNGAPGGLTGPVTNIYFGSERP